jgi:anti-sigma factor RsiW
MTEISRGDELLLDRFLDGALTAEALAECRRRLEDERALRAALRERMRLRRGFIAGRDAVFVPPAGFASRVLEATRRLPPAVDAGIDVIVVCRRILLAAAIVCAASLLWHSGLFVQHGDGTLQAAPDEAAEVIKALDERIQAGFTEAGRK